MDLDRNNWASFQEHDSHIVCSSMVLLLRKISEETGRRSFLMFAPAYLRNCVPLCRATELRSGEKETRGLLSLWGAGEATYPSFQSLGAVTSISVREGRRACSVAGFKRDSLGVSIVADCEHFLVSAFVGAVTASSPSVTTADAFLNRIL